jgi:hypothetical protein
MILIDVKQKAPCDKITRGFSKMAESTEHDSDAFLGHAKFSKLP